jgi:hypothetical protein
MSQQFHSPNDPHWDLVLAIAEALLIDGVHVVVLDPASTQTWVDVQWSVLEAERIFGLRTRVHTRKATDPRDRSVTLTITREDPTGDLTVNGRARLEALLRAVDDEFAFPVMSGAEDRLHSERPTMG